MDNKMFMTHCMADANTASAASSRSFGVLAQNGAMIRASFVFFGRIITGAVCGVLGLFLYFVICGI